MFSVMYREQDGTNYMQHGRMLKTKGAALKRADKLDDAYVTDERRKIVHLNSNIKRRIGLT